MPTEQEKQLQDYIAAVDNANDYADVKMAELENEAAEVIDQLLAEVEERDPELWLEFGVELELVVSEYESVPVEERDLDWSLGFAGMASAALYQYFLANRDKTIIEPAAYRFQKLDPFNLTGAQLVQAGKRGFEVLGIAEFEALQAKYTADLAFMRQLSNRELYSVLLENGAIRPIDQAIAANQGYLARMTNYPPGSTQFKEELANLVSANSKRGLRSLNRRSTQMLYTLDQAGANLQKKMVWIVEGGPNTCTYCLDNAGVVQTLEQWIIDGMPGAEVCAGADQCRCQLVAH
jgi:hypothetical protein